MLNTSPGDTGIWIPSIIPGSTLTQSFINFKGPIYESSRTVKHFKSVQMYDWC